MAAQPAIRPRRDAGRILVIEDDRAEADRLSRALAVTGYAVEWQADGGRGIIAVRDRDHDLVIVDLGRAGAEGVALCRAMRAATAAPIVGLAVAFSDREAVAALLAGADDVLAKPCSPLLLVGRIRALFRRRDLERAGHGGRGVQVGDLTIDFARHSATVAGRDVRLTPSELRLLGLLAERPGLPVPRDRLIRQLWGSEHVGNGRVCDMHVMNLRRKLGDDTASPRRIVTVRAFGYRLDPVTVERT